MPSASVGTGVELYYERHGAGWSLWTYKDVGLQGLVTQTIEALSAWTPEAVNALAGKDVSFALGERKLPFTAEGFLMSFSLPNFYFHAATAYDILRSNGVPLGKRDFMGRLNLKKA